MTEGRQFPPDEVGIELTEGSMALAARPAHRFESDGHVAWLLTRHEDIRQLLTDPRFSRAALAKPGNHDSISMMNGADHARVRSVVVRAFSARRIKRLRGRTEAIAAQLIDEMQRQGPPVVQSRRFRDPGRPDCSGDIARVDTVTWPFLQRCSKSNLASPMSITVTTPITR